MALNLQVKYILQQLVGLPEKLKNRLFSLAWGAILNSPDIKVHHSSHIKGFKGIKLGQRFSTGRFLWLEAVESFDGQVFTPNIAIGDGFNCSELVHIACTTSVTIGNGVLLGSKVLITDHNHGAYSGVRNHSAVTDAPNARPLVGSPVVIGDNVFIGDGVVVLPGSRIGDGTIVAANSVVSGTLQAETMYAGIPAAPIKRFDHASKRWLRVVKD